MKNISKKIIFTFIMFLFIITSTANTFGENSQKPQYISLNPMSSSYDVKKFQEFFKAIKIYEGEIDGNYNNLKPYIVDFQVENDIIANKNDVGAGYVGPKTYKFFNDKYGDRFIEAYSKFFEIKEPTVNEDKYFIVSAYYSPLPKQKKYSTGTYHGDIRLNGDGTHGASGASVHPGFIAAPSNYPFGTKIELEGLGIGIVEDRGGAIVREGVRGYEADRLDIWMGYGDEGLERALKWGKRKIKGKVLEKSVKITINFPTEYREYLAVKINPKSENKDLKKMQRLFTKARIYSGKIDGKYSSIKKAIIDFQVKNGIIQNEYDYVAGYVGPKTISKLEELYPDVFILVRREELKEVKEYIIFEKNSNHLLKKDKNKMKSIKEQLENKLKNKYGNDKEKIRSEKKLIIKKLENIIKNNKSNKNKIKINYLITLFK